jgi:hypothetical protein
MPKAIIVPCGAQILADGSLVMNYSAAILGPPDSSFGSDYTVNTSISVANNIIAWRNSVIAKGAEKGVTLNAADVIMFGLPG